MSEIIVYANNHNIKWSLKMQKINIYFSEGEGGGAKEMHHNTFLVKKHVFYDTSQFLNLGMIIIGEF